MSRKEALGARWEALMQSVEGPYAEAIRAEKDRYITEASTVFPTAGRLEDAMFDHHVAAMTALAIRFQGLAIRLSIAETSKQVRALQQKDAFDKLWLLLLRMWLSDYGLQAAKETAETTRSDMQHIIDAAFAETGEFNAVAVASSLLKARDLSAPRAETIARTETHNAMMFASVASAAALAREYDATLRKKWVPVLDARTRPSHAAMSSHPAISMEADFNVGGVAMSRPGDPRGGADNCINCRCVLAYEVVE